ncbi:large conductance mechanosensitive channel protein MscL [Paenibacillus hunanensis]|uniref:large conductance mechanosensitive channel protein MscL n=1 Tax=Paenibacillus hunanensis TaxID=539262 RepID=UPI0020268F76|nr:large conductance mechanosensitive channel protein MscL [Paenibacillus hunanensis]MCL9660798.1 large conductance mechanosensitive channel protein MscL [Paenibacillus hunanensis]
MGLVKEFKEFAVRGNVIDLAVGVIIGAAFGKIVTSLVNDIIMPPVGKLLGGVNFADLFINLDELTGSNAKHFVSLAEAQQAGAAVIAYGQFINNVIDFLIVALCVFLLVKGINMLKRKEHAKPEPEKTTRACPYCTNEVSIKATRCPHCTSQLDTAAPTL